MENDSTVFVGLDVHKDSINAACIGSHPSEQALDLGTIGTQQYAIDRLIKKLSGRGALHCVYEAGSCGSGSSVTFAPRTSGAWLLRRR